MAKKSTQWHKFRVASINKQASALPNTHHIEQSDTRWFTLETLGLKPNIQLKVPARLIEDKARYEGAQLEAVYENGRMRGRFVLSLTN